MYRRFSENDRIFKTKNPGWQARVINKLILFKTKFPLFWHLWNTKQGKRQQV